MAVQGALVSSPTRRRFVGTLAGITGACWLPAARAHGAVHRASRLMLGTRIDLVVQGLSSPNAAHAHQAAFDRMAQLEAMMSRYRPDSVVSALNRATGRAAIVVPNELMTVLQAARRLAETSEGRFDVTVGSLQAWDFRPGARGVPDESVLRAQRGLVGIDALALDEDAGTAWLQRRGVQIDLGGVAKLPILQAGLQVLVQHGVEGALVNGGGDVLVHGLVDGRPWRVGLRDPRRPETLLGQVELSHRGVVAASGDYERFRWHQGQRLHHILDPRTGHPTRGLRGLALVSNRIDAVNGMGAAMMVGGADWSRAWLEQHPETQAVMVDAADGVWRSRALDLRPAVSVS